MPHILDGICVGFNMCMYDVCVCGGVRVMVHVSRSENNFWVSPHLPRCLKTDFVLRKLAH